MQNKKAIELSINFLVVVILSLVILSSGIYLIRNFFRTTEEIKAQIDEQTEAQIENLLNQGELVAVPLNRRTIPIENYGLFGVGILNIDSSPKTFQLSVSFNAAYDKTNNQITNINGNDWLLYDSDPFTLQPNEDKKMAVLVDVPETQEGIYIFNVKVIDADTNQPYGDITKKIYVEVP